MRINLSARIQALLKILCYIIILRYNIKIVNLFVTKFIQQLTLIDICYDRKKNIIFLIAMSLMSK